jgi:glycosyltransferase involved in cell wall biosynthesis
VTLIIPAEWSESAEESELDEEDFKVVELPVLRSGDVNRHRYADTAQVREAVLQANPDVVDLHEEAFSAVTHQVLSALPPSLPVVMDAAQNVQKRYPPPFSRWARQAHNRVAGYYPCSTQAAAVLRRQGYRGQVVVIPLGFDPRVYFEGNQSHDADVFQVAIIGRLVPEKGLPDAIAATRAAGARLLVAGDPLDPVDRDAGAHVEWRLGYLPEAEIDRALGEATVAVFPYKPELDQSGALLRALGAGVPVVAYDVGGIAEPVLRFGAGAVVPPGDLPALAEAIENVLADPEPARAGALRAREELTWNASAHAHLDVYRELA